MSVYEDSFIAKDMINNKAHQYPMYASNSFIYKTSNENMNDIEYRRLLRNNDKTLSVIGSGDQIINSILYDSMDIDAFDISRFPKYFLELKLSAIQTLSYDEYIKFFYDNKAFSKTLFKKVIERMTNRDAKEFWTNIVNYNRFKKIDGLFSPRDVYYSKLFADGFNSFETAQEYNPYLSRYNYDLLRNKVKDAKINYLTGNIFDVDLYNEYDFINLSNICMYTGDYQRLGEPRYKNFITNLKLRDNGKVLSYITAFNRNGLSGKFYNNYFLNDERFSIHEVKSSDGIPDALLVYKKVK